MGRKHSDLDSFGDFQASIGEVSASAGVIGAWAFLVVALGFAIAGIWIFVKSRRAKDATAQQKKSGTWWLVGGSLGVAVAILNLVFSRWWNTEVHHNKSFAEAAGTMAEVSALKDMLRPSPPSGGFDFSSAPFAPPPSFAPLPFGNFPLLGP